MTLRILRALAGIMDMLWLCSGRTGMPADYAARIRGLNQSIKEVFITPNYNEI